MEERALAEAVFEASPAGLAVVAGDDLRVASCNAAFRAATARPEVDPVGLRLDELWPADEPFERSALARVLETGEPWRSDEHAVPVAGAVRRYSLHVSRLPRPGPPALLVALFETTGLWQARDDLVRMVVHDLRTPLGAILGHARLLLRVPGDAAQAEQRAHSIVRSCDRMAGMLQDLVEATLVEAGRLEVSCAPLDLAIHVPELVERLRGGIDAERVRILILPGAAFALADPARLERALLNLLTNALKYSPPQAPVYLTVGPAPGGGVSVAVADRGVGISPEDMPHLFERFFRARSARRPEGLGLGLYISRLLVEAQGGRLEVESALGSGSTFRIVLTAAPLPAPVAPA